MSYIYWPINYLVTILKLYVIMFGIIKLRKHNSRYLIVPAMISEVVIIGVSFLSILHVNLKETLIYLSPACAFITIFILLMQKQNVRSLLMSFIGLTILETAVNGIIYLVFDLSLSDFRDHAELNSVIDSTVLFIIILVWQILRAKDTETKYIDEPHGQSLLFTISSIGLLALSFYSFPVLMQDSFNSSMVINRAIFGVTMNTIIFIALTIFTHLNARQKETYQAKARDYALFVSSQQNYYSQRLENDCNIRAIRHDMQTHFHCIELYLDQGNICDAKKYVQTLLHKAFSKELKVYCGNPIFDMVANHIASQHQYVNLIVEGSMPKLSIKDIDLCILFSNSLSNAMRSASLCNTKSPVLVDIRYLGTNLIVKIVNQTNRVVKFSKGKPVNTSDDINHGFGVKNLCEVVDRYNSTVEFKQDGDTFITTIKLIDVIVLE